MFKNFQKVLAVGMTLAFVFMYYTPAQAAGLLSSAKVVLTEPRATLPSTYQFSMTTATAKVLKGVKVKWRYDASTTDAMPSSMSLAAAALVAGYTGLPTGQGNWTIDTTDVATGVVYLINAANTTEVAASTAITFSISGVTNASIAAAPVGCPPNPTNNSAGRCFNRIQLYDTETIATMQAETPGNISDQSTIAYTVNAGVNVTAKVDPALTFTVVGVASGAAMNGQNASATSDFNSLPFGYLATNTAKYLAHDLSVKTNANNGYTVSAEMVDKMDSVYTNDIDPFIQDKDAPITWGTPGAWATPDGTTANSNTGWIGMSTTDATGIGGWTGDVGDWGPVPDPSPTDNGNIVIHSSTPDLGTVATRISYAIEVNVYQPADSYTGILAYSCVPVY